MGVTGFSLMARMHRQMNKAHKLRETKSETLLIVDASRHLLDELSRRMDSVHCRDGQHSQAAGAGAQA
jgi:hypothetical protein